MTQKEKFIALLIMLFARTAFMFVDAIFYANRNQNFNPGNIQSKIAQENITNSKDSIGINMDDRPQNNIHTSADIVVPAQNDGDNLQKTIKDNIENGINNTKIKVKNILGSVSDLDVLEKIYKKNQDPDTLKLLLQKLVGDYQFEKAKDYIANINIFKTKSVDAKTYIYTYINTLSITDQNSMDKFMSFVDQLRYKSMINSDDYVFYQGLAKLRVKDYDGAMLLFKQISSPLYSNFISQLQESIQKYNSQKGVPSYYKDSLIALTALKNGYFAIANRLAVDSILQNPDYILPHQVVAYSNFLTKHWEKAIENFYDLVELDSDNQDKYNFYIGVSYYWLGKYQDSISMLSQLLDNPSYKTDAYRYLLLNYQVLQDDAKMVQVRQKLLGQSDLSASDFKSFYDIVFYKPFSLDSKYKIYDQYKQLSYDFVSMCYDILGPQNDTCLYGEAGLDIINHNWQNVKDTLIYLAENYPQAHIFQALGDYYRFQNLDDKAKTYYLKAVSLSDDLSQTKIIEDRLISEIN